MVVAGLLCLLAALTGAVLWADGKPRALLESNKLRILFGLVGVSLVAAGIWQERVIARSAVAKPDGDQLSDRVKELEKKIQQNEINMQSLNSELTLYRSTINRLAIDSRTGAIQAALASLSDHSAPAYCKQNAAAVIPVIWSPDEQSACARAINTFWPVEIVVPIKREREALQKSLQELKVPVAIADLSAKHPGLTADGLGIVYPEGTPHELLCALRLRFKARTGRDLTALAEATEYLNATKQPIRLTTIQAGVWFGEHFSSTLSSYRHFSDLDWQEVCTEDSAQFSATVRTRFKALIGASQPIGVK